MIWYQQLAFLHAFLWSLEVSTWYDIKLVKEVKYLGVLVDYQIIWTSQFALTTCKISRGIGMRRCACAVLEMRIMNISSCIANF